MTHSISRRRVRFALVTGTALALLAACDQPLDYDLRGGLGGFSTANAATSAQTAPRPSPDDRGVISYPNYQVAVAERGDTINDIATRLGVSAPELAQYNGIKANTPLRRGEIVALPAKITTPAPTSTAIPVQPGGVDINAIAGNAINRAPSSGATAGSDGVRTAALAPAATATPLPSAPKSSEPIRHKVVRGETAFTISRLYDVSVKSLAEWNGLGPDFAIREGQFLLIPVANTAAPIVAAAPVARPGAGSATPTPPSSAKPLPPAEKAVPVVAAPKVDVGEQTIKSADARMVFPVKGAIIREYNKDKNPGIDIKAAPGSPVLAADAGTVAAVTKSTDGVLIVVLRHDPQLLTVYANVTDLEIEKGDRVTRGQPIAKLRSGDASYVHFRVRDGGVDSVDPMLYLQ